MGEHLPGVLKGDGVARAFGPEIVLGETLRDFRLFEHPIHEPLPH